MEKLQIHICIFPPTQNPTSTNPTVYIIYLYIIIKPVTFDQFQLDFSELSDHE